MRKLYEQGKTAIAAGNYGEARDRYAEAFQRARLPKIAVRLGSVELLTGHYRDAAEHLSYGLQGDEKLSRGEKTAIEGQLAEAKKKVGTATLEVNVAGAEIFVDAQKVGSSPRSEPVFIDAGSRMFEAQKRGYASAREVVTVAAGSAPVVRLTLIPLAPPGAEAGAHGASGAATPTPDATPGWRSSAIRAGIGLTVVGLGAGVGLTFASNAEGAEAERQASKLTLNHDPSFAYACYPSTGRPITQTNVPKCNEIAGMRGTQYGLAVGALSGYVVGGVALLSTATLALWPKTRGTTQTGVLVLPSFGRSGGGMTVQGSF